MAGHDVAYGDATVAAERARVRGGSEEPLPRGGRWRTAGHARCARARDCVDALHETPQREHARGGAVCACACACGGALRAACACAHAVRAHAARASIMHVRMRERAAHDATCTLAQACATRRTH